MREGAGKSGDEYLAGPISREEPGRHPITARGAATGVGCRRAACVAVAKRSVPSGLLCCFLGALYRGPRRRREDRGGWCPPPVRFAAQAQERLLQRSQATSSKTTPPQPLLLQKDMTASAH